MTQFTLSELNFYPIKSAAGIPLQTAQVERRGLKGDRRWLVTDPQGMFQTQRSLPKMALISVAVENEALHLEAPGMPPLKVEPPENNGSVMQVEVWGDECKAISASATAHAWMSQYLGIDCRLVYMPEDSIRLVNQKYATDPTDHVSFADGFPFLLISQASLDDLNQRLESPLPMNRFRPNFVVIGCAPFAEDTWKRIRIGTMEFHLVKPCARCIVTTVDQQTANRGQEPLRTLAQYRMQDGKILFGQNLVSVGEGQISVGDAVEVLE